MEIYHIIDSNVLAIANELHDAASPHCTQNAINFLKMVQEKVDSSEPYIIVFDESQEVLREYRSHCPSNISQRFGSVFLKWLYRNHTKPQIIKINMPDDVENNSDLFPECFDGFDRNDRKYLFLALEYSRQSSTIHYGIDRGYKRFADCFVDNNIVLDEICA